MRRPIVLAAALFVLGSMTRAAQAQQVELDGPRVFLKGVSFPVTMTAPGATQPVRVQLRLADGTVVADTVIAPFEAVIVPGVVIRQGSEAPVLAESASGVTTMDRPVLPSWVSLLPPIVAIGLALITREVVTSLFAGIFVGCLFLTGFEPIAAAFMAANEFARGAVSDPNNAAILLFSLMLGGMVGVITRMGGTRAIVDAVAPLATTRARGQVATWAAGLGVFFDDYSNSLIVGTTMRPLTDKLKISREKLAYIVDSTAAPVAAVFFVSTWIGYEVGLIDDGLELAAAQNASNPQLAAELASVSGFGVFLQTIPYLFYPILAIFAVLVISLTGRDFGPMLRAERRAASGGGLARPGAQLAADVDAELSEASSAPAGRWWNGVLPVATLVVTVLGGLVVTGISALGPDDERSLRNIFGGSDPFSPLLWGALLACVVALALAGFQKILTVREGVDAWVSGLRAMLLAMVILVLAWSLGAVTRSLNTAGFLTEALSGNLPAVLLPVTTFLLAAAMAFATGTSWATMAIMLPLVVPLSITLAGGIDLEAGPGQAIVLGSIGSVLAGAIWGDHCSPISDTTVLSSTASGCDHMDHVRTQLPYALLVGTVAVVFGSIPSAMGLPPIVSLLLGGVAIWAVIRFRGQEVDAGLEREQ
ncbi:MAG: Na+/H+ antiporter NhaC family protein [Gemmatimonadetes bacterium]|nr:Na+/H+ antiporter NhaC family protein [Gemmatimonadota bacterium]